ncbi:hypothetical protein ACUN8C_01650 [Kushneria sp. Sum13]|uniref:hypothetical protein n=1 Tax=Kushneria sp. Sum13 TaxID=3459196 RepID=UPI00404609B9
MTLEIGYIICTVLAGIVGVRAARYQRGEGRGVVISFLAGILAGGFTGIFLMAMMVIIATPESRIEKIEPTADEQSAA